MHCCAKTVKMQLLHTFGSMPIYNLCMWQCVTFSETRVIKTTFIWVKNVATNIISHSSTHRKGETSTFINCTFTSSMQTQIEQY